MGRIKVAGDCILHCDCDGMSQTLFIRLCCGGDEPARIYKKTDTSRVFHRRVVSPSGPLSAAVCYNVRATDDVFSAQLINVHTQFHEYHRLTAATHCREPRGPGRRTVQALQWMGWRQTERSRQSTLEIGHCRVINDRTMSIRLLFTPALSRRYTATQQLILRCLSSPLSMLKQMARNVVICQKLWIIMPFPLSCVPGQPQPRSCLCISKKSRTYYTAICCRKVCTISVSRCLY